MGVLAIIPARIGSTRLPRKPLREIAGLPLIVHCLNSVRSTGLFSRVVVATDSKEIAQVVEEHSGEAIMTDERHPSGTDRVYEAAMKLSLGDDDIVLNVQGDQPITQKETLATLISFLKAHPETGMATCVCPMDGEEAKNPNRVKAVVGRDGHALYFSRAPIPFPRDGEVGGTFYLRHIGIYAYRVWFLQRFVQLPQGELEQIEKLEQLRALEHGWPIGVVHVASAPPDVDTEEDLRLVEQFIMGRPS